MTKLGRLAPVLLLPLALAGCGSSGDSGQFTVHGSLDVANTLPDQDRKGAFCDSTGNYPDIDAGTQVTVKDADGKTVGVGSLDAGTMTKAQATGGVCRYPFTITHVAGGSDLYAATISTRGDVTFKRSEADEVRLTLQ